MADTDPTQSNGRCSLCGQEEGHSPRCSVTKFGAPDIRMYESSDERTAKLEAALRLIAAPQRPDGSWNRSREACRQIAEEALR